MRSKLLFIAVIIWILGTFFLALGIIEREAFCVALGTGAVICSIVLFINGALRNKREEIYRPSASSLCGYAVGRDIDRIPYAEMDKKMWDIYREWKSEHPEAIEVIPLFRYAPLANFERKESLEQIVPTIVVKLYPDYIVREIKEGEVIKDFGIFHSEESDIDVFIREVKATICLKDGFSGMKALTFHSLEKSRVMY